MDTVIVVSKQLQLKTRKYGRYFSSSSSEWTTHLVRQVLAQPAAVVVPHLHDKQVEK